MTFPEFRASVSRVAPFKAKISSAKPKWYENIPEQGVLCWVWDDEEEPVIDKIVKYEKASLYHRFTGKNEDWLFARPVKFSDIQHLILNVG